MGLIAKVKGAYRAALSGWTGPLNEVVINGGLCTDAGQNVSYWTAKRVATLTAGINLLAGDVSSLPLHLMQMTPKGPQYATSHPLYRILNRQWNPETTAREGMEHSVRMLLMTGNFFNLLYHDPATGDITSIWPLHAPNVKGRRLTDYEMTRMGLDPARDSNLAWDYTDPDAATIRTFHDSQIWRASIYGNGLIGEGLVSLGKQSIGTAIAADKAGARLFKTGTVGDYYFKPEPGRDLSPDEWKKLQAAWMRGSDGSFAKPIIPDGVIVNKLEAPTAQQAQFIERLKRQDLEICRLLNIPASILDASEKGETFAASESQRKWYVIHSLRPYLTLIEQSIAARCLTRSEQDRYYAEFDPDVLTSADQQARYTANKDSLGGASWMTINEVRAEENKPPIPGGDVLLVPANNLGTLGKDGKIIPPAQPQQNKLQAMARAQAERIVRREQKSGKFDVEFVSDVLCVSPEAAKKYCADRTAGTITDSDAVTALVSLALE